jgi:predicted acetyltransferase
MQINIDIVQAQPSDKLKLHNLLQFYIYDFSEFLPFELNEDGLYNQSILEDYFANPEKAAYFILVNNTLAGFVLVSGETKLIENEGGRCIKEFFIAKRYRRRGIGKTVAKRIFTMYEGKWEVRVERTNEVARRFWEATIKEQTGERYKREEREDEEWRGVIYSLAVGPTAV